MEKSIRKFKDLPEHTQMFLSSLLADVNYLKGATLSQHEPMYYDAKERYENACAREGVTPYVQE